MNQIKAQQLHKDMDQFLETTKKLVGEFHDRINLMAVEAEVKQATQQPAVQPAEQKGILIDYKTFSEVVNALACAVSSGDVGAQSVYEKLVVLGKGQQPVVKQVVKPVAKPEVKAKPQLPGFLQEIIEKLEAELEADAKAEAAATLTSESKEDADIEKLIKEQFPGMDIKFLNNPMELLALLGAMGDMKGKTNRRF